MNQLVLVQICNGREDLSNDLGCILFCKEHSTVNILINLTEQVTTLAQLGHNKETLFILIYLLETKHVRMV